MAEAHQAVAFQFVVTDEGILFHYDKKAVKEALVSFLGFYRTRFLRARTALYRGIFPASPVSLAVVLTLVLCVYAVGADPTYGALPWAIGISK